MVCSTPIVLIWAKVVKQAIAACFETSQLASKWAGGCKSGCNIYIQLVGLAKCHLCSCTIWIIGTSECLFLKLVVQMSAYIYRMPIFMGRFNTHVKQGE